MAQIVALILSNCSTDDNFVSDKSWRDYIPTHHDLFYYYLIHSTAARSTGNVAL